MTTLQFKTPPTIGLVAMGTKRGAGLRGGTIPHIEASASRIDANPGEYAAICGFPASRRLPPTYPDILVRGLQLAVLTHPLFPLPLLGILHVRQRIDALRPIYADEALSGRAWVDGHRLARKGIEFDLRSEVSAGGEPVWRGVTTILSQAAPGDGVKRPPQQPVSFAPSRSVVWSLPGDLGRRYSAVSGDANPIHLWPLTARLFGFRKPIIHGWWLLARSLAELDHEVPTQFTLQARFASPVAMPGSVLFESGSVGGATHFHLRRKELCLAGTISPLEVP